MPAPSTAPSSAVLEAAAGWHVTGGPRVPLWASCTPGTESLAAEELAWLGWRPPDDRPPGARERPGPTGLDVGHGAVHGRADLAATYRTLFASRTVDRVSLRLARAPVTRLREVTDLVADLDLGCLPPAPFAVRARRAGRHAFRSTELAGAAGAGVIAAHRRATGRRLPVDLDDPVTVLRVDLVDRWLCVGIELTAGELHRRPWWVAPHRAGLRPTVAAGLLLLAGWRAGETLLDPMTGAATIPIEAALAAGRRPPWPATPGRLAHLPVHEPRLAGAVDRELARRRRDRPPARISGLDRSGGALALARRNRAAAGLTDEDLALRRGDVRRLPAPATVDCVVANPPYGVRLARPGEVEGLYRALLARVAPLLAPAGRAVILAPEAGMVRRAARGTGLRPARWCTLARGSLEVVACRLDPA